MRLRTFAFATLCLAFALPARGQDFREVVDQLTRAWQRGDFSMLGSHAAANGLSLDIEGRRIGPFASRQAATAIRRLFEDRETIQASLNMAREVSGEPRRAFAELTWVTRARGTTIPQRSTIVLTLQLERDRWRITEIRLVR